MIVTVTRKMENILSSGPFNIPVALANEIFEAETNAYLTGAFNGEETDQFIAIRDFYERLIVLMVEARNFEDLSQKFILLERLYKNKGSQIQPSLYEAKLISLYLLFLYTGENVENFQIKLAEISPSLLNSAEVRTICEFEQLISLGNYQRAFDIVQTLSPSHQIILARLIDQRRYQTCKMIEYSYPDIQLADLYKILDLKNQEDSENALKMINSLYEKGEINWSVKEGNHMYKREEVSKFLNDEKVIRETIDLLRDFEKII